MNRIKRLIQKLVRLGLSFRLKRLGTEYGGWTIPWKLLGKQSVCYCVGAGEDISFEEELNASVGCTIYTIDPTPRAEIYVRKWLDQNSDASVHFLKVGLWCDDSIQRFYEPADSSHVSHSILNLQQTSKFFEAPCLRLSTLMKLLGHGSIDLLKLDIEGAEGAVLRTLGEEQIFPRIVCVEFDEARVKGRGRMTDLLDLMKSFGYRCAYAENWNYTFIRVAG